MVSVVSLLPTTFIGQDCVFFPRRRPERSWMLTFVRPFLFVNAKFGHPTLALLMGHASEARKHTTTTTSPQNEICDIVL